MADTKCPFCNSEKIMVETPYINRHGEKITTYCCLAQKKNHGYITSHHNRYSEFQISADEVAKL